MAASWLMYALLLAVPFCVNAVGARFLDWEIRAISVMERGASFSAVKVASSAITSCMRAALPKEIL